MTVHSDKRITPNGGVAQLGEHLPCKQGVMGSIPIISTRLPKEVTFSLFTFHSSLRERGRKEEMGSESKTRYTEGSNGLIAQVVRARA